MGVSHVLQFGWWVPTAYCQIPWDTASRICPKRFRFSSNVHCTEELENAWPHKHLRLSNSCNFMSETGKYPTTNKPWLQDDASSKRNDALSAKTKLPREKRELYKPRREFLLFCLGISSKEWACWLWVGAEGTLRWNDRTSTHGVTSGIFFPLDVAWCEKLWFQADQFHEIMGNFGHSSNSRFQNLVHSRNGSTPAELRTGLLHQGIQSVLMCLGSNQARHVWKQIYTSSHEKGPYALQDEPRRNLIAITYICINFNIYSPETVSRSPVTDRFFTPRHQSKG